MGCAYTALLRIGDNATVCDKLGATYLPVPTLTYSTVERCIFMGAVKSLSHLVLLTLPYFRMRLASKPLTIPTCLSTINVAFNQEELEEKEEEPFAPCAAWVSGNVPERISRPTSPLKAKKRGPKILRTGPKIGQVRFSYFHGASCQCRATHTTWFFDVTQFYRFYHPRPMIDRTNSFH